LLTFVLAPDSLKGALSAAQCCVAMRRGIERACASTRSAHHILSIPLADGGEGTVEAFHAGAGGEIQRTTVLGPLGNAVEAQWLRLPDGRAVLEMAQASGLTLVPPAGRRALHASSFGTGELIRAALDAGCREILLGIGGSATTDGGSGALAALGARFLDHNGQELAPGGASLNALAEIDLSQLDARLAQTPIRVLCDVTNPLYGEQGAAHVYGPQKGASPRRCAALWMRRCVTWPMSRVLASGETCSAVPARARRAASVSGCWRFAARVLCPVSKPCWM
jgi:glycerate kinase